MAVRAGDMADGSAPEAVVLRVVGRVDRVVDARSGVAERDVALDGGGAGPDEPGFGEQGHFDVAGAGALADPTARRFTATPAAHDQVHRAHVVGPDGWGGSSRRGTGRRGQGRRCSGTYSILSASPVLAIAYVRQPGGAVHVLVGLDASGTVIQSTRSRSTSPASREPVMNSAEPASRSSRTPA